MDSRSDSILRFIFEVYVFISSDYIKDTYLYGEFTSGVLGRNKAMKASLNDTSPAVPWEVDLHLTNYLLCMPIHWGNPVDKISLNFPLHGF